MTKYWILVAPKDYVLQGKAADYAQACHGKSNPMRRLNMGDGIIYYSPKLKLDADDPYQSFTALGCVIDDKPYQIELADQSKHHRRHIRYLSAKDVKVKPLINHLTFIKDKDRWGSVFKFGIIQIPEQDFKLIATAMNISNN